MQQIDLPKTCRSTNGNKLIVSSDNSLVYERQICRIVSHRIKELLNMNDLDRAMEAYRAMTDECQIDIVPILVAVALTFPRKTTLRLVTVHGRELPLGRAVGSRLN